jgi:hypothetical protein
MFKLKSKFIIAVMVIFGITIFMSCEKNTTESDVIVAKPEASKPIDGFTVTFNPQGSFTTNDAVFVRNNSLISKALSKLNSDLDNFKSTKTTSFTINQDGRIISENEYYNNRLFAEVLINEGNLQYFDQEFTVTYDNNGFKNISNEEYFLQNPLLKQSFIDAGEGYKGKVPANKEISIHFSGNRFFVNGKEVPLFSSFKSANGEKYDYFKDCVGYYWWAIGFNIPMCGIAVLVEFYIID